MTVWSDSETQDWRTKEVIDQLRACRLTLYRNDFIFGGGDLDNFSLVLHEEVGSSPEAGDPPNGQGQLRRESTTTVCPFGGVDVFSCCVGNSSRKSHLV